MASEVGSESVKEPEELETKRNAGTEPENPEEQASELAQRSPISQLPADQSSPSRSKKEKDSSEAKGISRFIPPWLKKQKSYSLAEHKDDAKKKQLIEAGDETVVEQGKYHPEEATATTEKLEDVIENRQETTADKEEEKHSVSSAETQVYFGKE